MRVFGTTEIRLALYSLVLQFMVCYRYTNGINLNF